jgi:cobalt-zinc-cadmium resistance protein CzcA
MNKIVAFALHHRGLMVILLAALLLAGGFAFSRLNIEAYPDPVPPMVEVVTQLAGYSAEEMERNVTVPVEVQMSGVPHVASVRSVSLFGLSDVKIQFTYDYSHEEAQQQVINRLSQLNGLLFPDRPEDPAGLGAAAPLQGGAGGDRRHRLGRQDPHL